MSAIDSAEIQETLSRLSEKQYYRIGEVAQITQIKPYVLRFWESEFNVISPPKSRSKQRMYRKKDIETILCIKHLLYSEGFTIKGARRRMLERAREERGAGPLDLDLEAELTQLRSELGEICELLGKD